MATKFLKDKKRTELADLAELTNLPAHKGMKKEEIIGALDSHLTTNATTYQDQPELKDYYGGKKSPVKKSIEKVLSSAGLTSDEEKPKAKGRRKTAGAESTSTELAPTTPKEVARRTSTILPTQSLGSPSMGAVSDMVKQGQRRVTSSISKVYEQTQVEEYASWARDNLSSAGAINLIATVFEALYLRAGILPFRKAFDLPNLFTGERFDVYGPDLFVFLTPEFWAPFTLWLLTSSVLPTLVASLINLSQKASSSHGYGTRRATAASSVQPDTLIFFVAKALISYLVYHDHAIVGLYSNFTVATVNESIYAGYSGMITAALIGVVASLYEAVLKK